MRTDGPGQSALLLLDVIEVLNSFQVTYAVVDALAVSFYGPVRASMDADAIISLGPDKLQEDFIAMKIFAGSPLDLEDASGVMKISRDKVNLTLLRELVQRFGKNELAKLKALLK